MADHSMTQKDLAKSSEFAELTTALIALQDSIFKELALAAQVFRLSPADLSADERAHAAYWARMAVSMMSQRMARDVDAAVKAKVAHVILEAAAEVKEFNADHSYGYLASQAIDRMANRLLAEDLPLQIREAAYDAIGGQK